MSEVALSASGLCKSFGGVKAVQNVDLALPPGKVTALLGPNGAGKTTVFNLLSGRTLPDEGTVKFADQDISQLSVAQRARLGIGRTFQDVRLFGGMTVLDNVMVYAQVAKGQSLFATLLAPWNRVKEDRAALDEARAALGYVGASQFEHRIAGDLSYAEQKLVSIARLLAMRSKVLLLDEPASGVDDLGRERLTSVIRKLADDQRTICLIEHNLDVVKGLADRVVFVAQGAIVAEGDPTSIFESAELAEIYFGERRGR